MLAKPRSLIDREREWQALERFVERRQRLAVVYGPRRVGKSYLLEALCERAGGVRYQAIRGVAPAQLDDFGRALGGLLGVGALRLDSWAEAFDAVRRLDTAALVIDELPYLTETAPELPSVIQRYVDAKGGPPLVLAGSSLATMTDLVTAQAPLYGRSAAVVVPAPFTGRDLVKLWGASDPRVGLWIDAAVGGLPGYRPLVEPPGTDLDAWMVDEILAPSSPLLDAAEAALVDVAAAVSRGVYHTILAAIAGGARSFSAIARVAGRPTGALTRPISALERAGLVTRVVDPLRSRRDLYDLADPHLRTWLTIIAPHRAALQAGRAAEVWRRVRETTWRAQVLGPRWEAAVRTHLAGSLDGVDVVGATTVSDRSERASHEIDLVAMRGREVVAIGEAKLRRLGPPDADRLRALRTLLGAPNAQLILASAEAVDRGPDVIPILPRNLYTA